MADPKHSPFSRLLILSGILLLTLGLALLAWIFLPLLSQEIKYELKANLSQLPVSVPATPVEVTPPDPDFSIYIPKISALAPVVANVDPYDSRIYQRQLTRGVAHAKGSALPGSIGRTFLFAHSAGNPLEASRFNAVFFLLSKLDSGDEISVWYAGEHLYYRVTEKKLVPASDVEYLSSGSDANTLVLMTCWPPGTSLRRLLIFAVPDTSQSRSLEITP